MTDYSDFEHLSDDELIQWLNSVLEQRWKNLTFASDYVFSQLMRDKDNCMGLLQRIMPGIEISDIQYTRISKKKMKPDTQIQKIFQDSPFSRGVRLDVYVKSADGTKIYDVEMQTANTKDLDRRSGAYHAAMINDLLRRDKKPYKDTPDSYVIFICRFDPFNLGRYVYNFRSICVDDTSLVLNDGRHTIFLNSKGKDEENITPEMKKVLDFINGQVCDDPFIMKLSNQLEELKQNIYRRRDYMLRELDLISQRAYYKDEGLAQGMAQGIERGMAQGIERGLAQGKTEGWKASKFDTARNLKEMGLSYADIMRATNLSPEDMKLL